MSYEVELDLRELATGTRFDSTVRVRFRAQPGASFLELDGELVEGELGGRSNLRSSSSSSSSAGV